MEDETSYFRRRAAEEMAAADRADDTVTAEIHRSLAARLLAKAGEEPTTAPPAAESERHPVDG